MWNDELFWTRDGRLTDVCLPCHQARRAHYEARRRAKKQGSTSPAQISARATIAAQDSGIEGNVYCLYYLSKDNGKTVDTPLGGSEAQAVGVLQGSRRHRK